MILFAANFVFGLALWQTIKYTHKHHVKAEK